MQKTGFIEGSGLMGHVITRGGTIHDTRFDVLRTSVVLVLVAAFVLTAFNAGAAPSNKCVIDGTVTYQQGPCPSKEVRKRPTIQQLNAEEKERRAAAAATAPATAATAATAPATAAPAATGVARSSGCDGRKHCSQMKSCTEAKYFLANCPGVEMDGDRDGIPCEQQWCTR